MLTYRFTREPRRWCSVLRPRAPSSRIADLVFYLPRGFFVARGEAREDQADAHPVSRAVRGVLIEAVSDHELLAQRRISAADYLPTGDPPCEPPPVGGRLAVFSQTWQSITQDPFILSVISHGFQISVLDSFPGFLRQTTVTPLSRVKRAAIHKEIVALLSKEAIVQIDDFPSLCLSPIFVIPKVTGGLRVILNLKDINVFIPVQHFRMETLAVILPQISAGDWAVSIDLRDAYLHVPIHVRYRRLLGFQFQGRTYQYRVLPFGLRDSPWVFTRLVASLVGYLRLRGVRIFHYLDDWLVVAGSEALLFDHLDLVLRTAQQLGFLINWEKSSLIPQRCPVYLGAVLNFPSRLARPSDRRILALRSVVYSLTASPLAPARLWQVFLGHLASFVDLVPHCRLLMRPLQLHFLGHFNPLSDPVEKLIPLPPPSNAFV